MFTVIQVNTFLVRVTTICRYICEQHVLYFPSYVRLQRNKLPLIGIMVNFHYSRVLASATKY